MPINPTIDPDSPLLVGKGILSLAVLGAATGGTLGALQAQNPALLALRMGMNGSIAGLAFFGIREYLVSPVLVSTLGSNDNWPSYVHRRVSTSASTSDSSSTAHANSLLQQRRENNEKHGVSGVPPLPQSQSPEETVSAIRNDRVLDSCLAGGMAGSIISGTFRGPRTVPAAFITSALITSSLQYGINTIRAARVQTLLMRQQQQQTLSSPPPLPSTASTPTTTPHTTQPTQLITPPPPPTRPTILSRIKESLTNLSPIRQLSDAEYALILTRQRAAVVADLEAYERWAAERAAGRSAELPPADPNASRGKTMERPKINVEQAVRELDGLERKIRALQDRRDALAAAEEEEEKDGRSKSEAVTAV